MRICLRMTTWGIVISILALAFGVAGAVLAFMGWNRKNRNRPSGLFFILAAVGGVIFGGLLYLGGRLGLLW